jgi:ABC-type sugar transport system substrate-binding protein
MKKTMAMILLSLVLLFSLFACGSDGSNPPETETPDASDPAVPSPSPSEPIPSESGGDGVSVPSAGVGYFEDEVDHSARDTYNICFGHPARMLMNEILANAMRGFEEKLNFKLSEASADNDMESYIVNIEIMAQSGVDGFVLQSEETIAPRLLEVISDYDIPYVAFVNGIYEAPGSSILAAPSVLVDGYAGGAAQAQWFFDNYKSYFGDIDATKIGCFDLTLSSWTDFSVRSDGSVGRFKELFPESTEFYTGDALQGLLDADTGYKLTTATLSGHPEIEYWFISAVMEDLGQGAARAVEAMNMQDNVLITTFGTDLLIPAWESGYEGCWAAGVTIPPQGYVAPALGAVIALIDGRAEPETLWLDRRPQTEAEFGSNYTAYLVEQKMVTKDTYQAFFDEADAKYGKLPE